MDLNTFKDAGRALSVNLPNLTFSEVVVVLETLNPWMVTTGQEQAPGETTRDWLVRRALDSTKVMDAVRDNKKINAIKELRSITSAGLKDAKEAVEDYRVARFSQDGNWGYSGHW